MTAAPLSLLSTLAVMGVLQEILPGYEHQTGVRVTAAFAPTQELLARIAAGARGDAVILTDSAVDDLIASGILAPGSRVDLARSFIGVAVRAGAPHPDIGTDTAFRQTLLDASSIAYSAAGASGLFFASLIDQLGIGDAVRAKATVIPTGLTGALAARGETELAIQQVSELMVVPGIDIVGRLPDTLHRGAVFSGAVFAQAGEAASALLRALASDAIGPVYRRHGVEPIAPG